VEEAVAKEAVAKEAVAKEDGVEEDGVVEETHKSDDLSLKSTDNKSDEDHVDLSNKNGRSPALHPFCSLPDWGSLLTTSRSSPLLLSREPAKMSSVSIASLT
jgi:hypothetical protein